MGLETAALIAGLSGIGGGIAGAMGSKSSTGFSSNTNAGTANADEQFGGATVRNNVGALQGMVDASGNASDVAASTGAQRDLASLLQQMSQTGGLPSQGDISTSNQLAGNMFQAQRTQLQQAFQDQDVASQRQRALMGRDGADPILQAKLAQEQTRQQAMLGAEQGAWAQNFALNLPGQRLGYASQRANVLGGLATQAMSNRQALAAMGEAMQTNERNFRLQTASRYGTQTSDSGGGVAGAISGAFAGLGAGAQIASGFGWGKAPTTTPSTPAVASAATPSSAISRAPAGISASQFAGPVNGPWPQVYGAPIGPQPVAAFGPQAFGPNFNYGGIR